LLRGLELSQGGFDAAGAHDFADVVRDLTVDIDRLARTMASEGRADDAAELYRSVLAIKRRVFGVQHHEVARTIHDLALLYDAFGDPDKARALWREAQALLDRTVE
jgi:hypothetical protein